jgi:hypothetical protein
MKFTTAALLGAAMLLAAPAWSATIYGGFEDTIGGDYDYNDIVFSLSGSGLSINLNGASLFAKPTLNGATGVYGLNGTPFWNNDSQDGANDNVGFCIYGGGACNGGTGLDPSADYIAASATKTGSANNITFTDTVGTTANVILSITAVTDTLGWYNTSTPGTINFLGGVGTYSFNPGGNFGLVGEVNGTTTYYSNTAAGGTQDPNSGVSHFAFFTNAAAPEPSTFLLIGAGFVALGGLRRRPAFFSKYGRSKK